MSLRRPRILIAAGVSTSLLAGFAAAESSSATTPLTESSETISDSVTDTSAVATSDTVPEASVATTPETAAVEIIPPDEPWGGLTRGEWDARSWQWILSLPEDINPWFDTAGERCGYGQSGPVFLLTPAEGEITCVVAEGTAIWVNVANTECSTVEPPPYFGRNEDELRACATAEVDGVTDYQARVNGQGVANLDAYRTASPMFTFILPENNVFGLEPGVADAVSEGYSFIIAPPPPGEYEIAWTARYPGEPTTRPTTTVTVIVEAPRVIEPTTT